MLRVTVVLAIIITIGYFIAGPSGILVAIGIALVMNLISYFLADEIFLAFSGAVEIKEHEMPWLHELLDRICKNASLHKPRLFLLPEMQPNACATGRNKNKAIVAVTAGLVKLLKKDEIEAVLAHEITHIRSNDLFIAAIAATLASAVAILAHILYGVIVSNLRTSNNRGVSALMDLAFIIIAPILAVIIQTIISRSREYKADSGAVTLMKNKEPMKNALIKIDSYIRKVPMRADSPAYAHMYISNPMHSKFLRRVLSSHPVLEDRLKNIDRTNI